LAAERADLVGRGGVDALLVVAARDLLGALGQRAQRPQRAGGDEHDADADAERDHREEQRGPDRAILFLLQAQRRLLRAQLELDAEVRQVLADRLLLPPQALARRTQPIGIAAEQR